MALATLAAPTAPPAVSVFTDTVFTEYRATLQIRSKLMGGTPRDPALIEAWLRTKLPESTDAAEIRQMMLRTMLESGMDVNDEMSMDDLISASRKVAAEKNTNGFRRDPDLGLYLESRCVKAMLRENVNVLYAGERVGRTKKGAKNYFNERVFVHPEIIPLGVTEPSGIDLCIGHVVGPQGPRANLTYVEYVWRPALHLTIKVLKDEVPADWWPEIWVLAQENGLGSRRSQDAGRFDVVEWEQVR